FSIIRERTLTATALIGLGKALGPPVAGLRHCLRRLSRRKRPRDPAGSWWCGNPSAGAREGGTSGSAAHRRAALRTSSAAPGAAAASASSRPRYRYRGGSAVRGPSARGPGETARLPEKIRPCSRMSGTLAQESSVLACARFSAVEAEHVARYRGEPDASCSL